MKNNLHVFLGSTVADAAARPLHWVYNQKKLLTYIKGKKDFTFLKKNKSPFYNIKTGKVSGYNDIGQVMLKTLLEGHDNIEERFKKNITKNFGPRSEYWKNFKLRAKYRKVKDWRGIIKGPWIHQNIIETVRNIKNKKRITGGKKVNESDGYCAALPYFLYGYSFNNLKSATLISIGQSCADDCIAIFTKYDVKILKDDKILIKGRRTANGLWKIPIDTAIKPSAVQSPTNLATPVANGVLEPFKCSRPNILSAFLM